LIHRLGWHYIPAPRPRYAALDWMSCTRQLVCAAAITIELGGSDAGKARNVVVADALAELNAVRSGDEDGAEVGGSHRRGVVLVVIPQDDRPRVYMEGGREHLVDMPHRQRLPIPCRVSGLCGRARVVARVRWIDRVC